MTPRAFRYTPVPPVTASVVLWLSLNGPSTVMPPPFTNVIHRHPHEPADGEIRMQSPWSWPALAMLAALKTTLWNVKRSPEVSPCAPVLITVSVVACSITWTVGVVDVPDAHEEATAATVTPTASKATTTNDLFMIPPPRRHRTGSVC